MILPPGLVDYDISNPSITSRDRTHINGSLQTAFHTRTLKHSIHLSNPTRSLDHLGNFFRKHQFILDLCVPLHWYNDLSIGKLILHREIPSIRLDISSHNCLGSRVLAHCCAKKSNSTSAEDEHRTFRFESGSA